MSGDSWLAFMGVPDWVPGYGDLEQEVTEAMMDAAEQVLADAEAANVAIRVARELGPCQWAYATLPVEQLRTGMRTSRGSLQIGHHPDTGELLWITEVFDSPRPYGVDRESTRPSEWSRAILVPIPFDAASIVAEWSTEVHQ